MVSGLVLSQYFFVIFNEGVLLLRKILEMNGTLS